MPGLVSKIIVYIYFSSKKNFLQNALLSGLLCRGLALLDREPALLGSGGDWLDTFRPAHGIECVRSAWIAR